MLLACRRFWDLESFRKRCDMRRNVAAALLEVKYTTYLAPPRHIVMCFPWCSGRFIYGALHMDWM